MKPEDITVVQHCPSYRPANLIAVDAFDRNNKRCYTTLFCDNNEKIYLMAVGGKSVGVNGGGVYWYRTSEGAIEAIEGVIVYWQNVQLEFTVFDCLLDTNLSNTYASTTTTFHFQSSCLPSYCSTLTILQFR